MKNQNIHQIACKLIGPITPIGCHREDAKRLDNIKEAIEVANALVLNIYNVAQYADSHEASVSSVGQEAKKWIKSLDDFNS